MSDVRLTHDVVNTEAVFGWPGFSHAVIGGAHIYLSGVLGTEGSNLELADTVADQTRQTIANIDLVLDACGASMADLVKVTVFLSDISTFLEMDQIYREMMPSPPPARVTVECSALSLGAAIELDAVAVRS